MSVAQTTNTIQTLHTPAEAAAWLRNYASQLQTDSRQLQAQDAFIAQAGSHHDARQYIDQALQQGVAAVLAEAKDAAQFNVPVADNVALYANLKCDVAHIAAAFYGQPSSQLDIIAITGTNGKTSSAWYLAQALSNEAPAAMVGTLGVGVFQQGTANLKPTGLTTPEPVLLQQQLHQWVQAQVPVCVMEASSIGIEEHRLDATQIHTAVFTNFSQDHLDYHGDMASYKAAKRKLFNWAGLQAAVINIDDAFGQELAAGLRVHDAVALWTVACEDSNARLYARDICYVNGGLQFMVCEHNGDTVSMQTHLIGNYNVLNMLGVLACLRLRGYSLTQAAARCQHLQPVLGRMQCITQKNSPLVVVDYAHTPDALEKALVAVRALSDSRNGRVWCVFGCGGDRDSSKRPLMGAAAAQLADVCVVTSDNPRSEVPENIINDIMAGMGGAAHHTQADRAQAIAYAIDQAHADDVILIAGKGHEDYQEIHGHKQPFSDVQQAQAALQAKGAA